MIDGMPGIQEIGVMADWIGYFAAFCTTAALVPQALQVWHTRRTQDLSLVMFLLLCIGLVLWLIYGLILGSMPLIIANGCTLVLAGYCLYMKLTEKSRG